LIIKALHDVASTIDRIRSLTGYIVLFKTMEEKDQPVPCRNRQFVSGGWIDRLHLADKEMDASILPV
jgi:hypothetical protein